MKRYIFSVLFLAFLSTAYSQNGKLKIATYNTKNDTQKTEPWINLRQFGARDFLEHYQMDIIGTQEFFHHQLKYIVDSIPTKYKYAGVIRKEKEEYNAILYKEEKVRLLDTGTFWLSDTPDIPGSKFQGIDYDYIRICTWAKFQVKENGFTFFFFNKNV
ncbi:MAG: hypothetical protein LIO93_04330 [Bacteroidales bacterium]|nr:hypothetical protein [Bacteroidales bacterium]